VLPSRNIHEQQKITSKAHSRESGYNIIQLAIAPAATPFIWAGESGPGDERLENRSCLFWVYYLSGIDPYN
jgi:hypothetical protein